MLPALTTSRKCAGEAIDQQVVHEGALRRQQAGVLRLPDLQLRRVVARDALDGGQRVLAGDFDLAHVADVEEAGARADGHVLRDDARSTRRACPSRRTAPFWRPTRDGER